MSLGVIDFNKKPLDMEIYLAKPDKTIIAKLKDAYNKKLHISFGEIGQISFSIPYDVDRNHSMTRTPYIDNIRERYLIKVKIGNDVDWYIINKITQISEDSDSKQINAMLLSYELKDKIIRIYNTENSGPKTCTQVLTDALNGTLWSVGTITAAFDVVKRSFDVSSKTALDFIYEIAETFKGVIQWNTDNREISIVEESSIGQNKGLRFSYEKYLKSINKESSVEDMATRLYVFGKDDLSINRVNPTGTNYIEDFSYFMYPFQQDNLGNVLKHSNYMSDNLCKAIIDYNTLVSSKQGDFSNFLSQKEVKITDKDEKELEITILEFEKSQIEDIKDVQQAVSTYNELKYNYSNITTASTFSLESGVSGKKHAVLMKVVNPTGLTVTYKFGANAPVNKNLIANTWTVVSKESVNPDTNIVITVSGTGSTVVHIVTIEIKNYEYDGIIYEGNSIISSGSVNSILTTTDLETSWRTVKTGDRVYVENGTTPGYQEEGNPGSDFIGIVQSVDLSDADNHKIVLDRQFTAGTYSSGYRITGLDSNSAIINNYCLDSKESELSLANYELGVINADIASIDNDIENLRNEISIENNFNANEIEERSFYIIEREFYDQNYVDDEVLYEDAKKEFDKIKEPQIIINVDIVNFLEIVESQKDWEKLSIGDTIGVYYEKFNLNITARLIEIDYDYESGNVNVTIANIKDVEDDRKKIYKMIYKSVSSSTKVNINKNKWDQTTTDLGKIGEIINNKWDTATREIAAGVNESVIINGRGITILDPNDPLKLLRATHGILGISSDGGASFRHAITSQGILAERLYGQIITGNNLIIGDADGVLQILGNKATITDDQLNEVMKFGLYETSPSDKFGILLQKFDISNNITHKVIMDKDDGFKIKRNIGGGNYEDIVYIDLNGKIVIKDLIATGTITTPSLTVANIDVNDLIYNATEGLRTFGTWIKGDMIEVNTISANKIKTSELIVGDNITLGPNAVITYGQVTGGPPANADNTYSTIGNDRLTYINSTGIYTGTLQANQIIAGTITGFTIQTSANANSKIILDSTNGLRAIDGSGNVTVQITTAGSATFKGSIQSGSTITGSSITGGSISVSTDVSIGSTLIIDPTNFGAGVQWGSGVTQKAKIYLDPVTSALTISADGPIYAGSQRIDQPIVAVFG